MNIYPLGKTLLIHKGKIAYHGDRLNMSCIRKYSFTSANYLETLDKLEIKFREIIEKIWKLQNLTTDPTNTREKVVRSQAELAQLYGELDKFQVPFSDWSSLTLPATLLPSPQ